MTVQVLQGLGNGVTLALGSLLAADLAGMAWGGSAATVTTVGAALWAVPLARLVSARGRKISLMTGLALGSLGAFSAFIGAQTHLFAFVLLGFFFLGASVATNLQSRFAAADGSDDRHRGRDISLVVWATTAGAVAGPNLFDVTEKLGASLGLQPYATAYLLCICTQWLAVLTLTGLPKLVATRSAPPQIRLSRFPQVMTPIGTNAVSHFSMIALMSMTAVHMDHHGATITLIGITISAHIAGMYGLSPLFGILSDAASPRVSVLLGLGLTSAACLILLGMSTSHPAVVTALVLLGLGWSATLVGTSAQVTARVDAAHRPGVQGRSDLVMNLTGAAGGIIAGPVVSRFGMEIMAVLVLSLIAASQIAFARYRSTIAQS